MSSVHPLLCRFLFRPLKFFVSYAILYDTQSRNHTLPSTLQLPLLEGEGRGCSPFSMDNRFLPRNGGLSAALDGR